MGARPLFGLNVAGWNTAELPTELLIEVLAGAADVAADEGWLIIGGHTVDDPEPKVGVVVIGEVHPDQLLEKSGLRPGDALVLTKALGVGLAATALKAGAAPPAAVEAAVASMLRTNREAAAAARDAGASAATDVTGFGLLGHLRSMLDASAVGATIDVAAVPLLEGAQELVAGGFAPGGTDRNLSWVRDCLDASGTDERCLPLLADPQTSGGLLFGAEPQRAEGAAAALRRTGHAAAVIGTVSPGPAHITLR
jgi:selenide,water dikinase